MSEALLSPPRSKTMRNGALAAAVVATVSGFEGLRLTAYPDPASRGAPWTVCYGHTGPEVVPGYRASLAECRALLARDLDRAAVAVESCLVRSMTDGQAAAFLSLAYNIGAAGFCRSSVARAFRAG